MSITSRVISFSSPLAPFTLNESTITLPPAPDCIVVELFGLALNPIDFKLKALQFFGGVLGRDFAGVVRHVGANAEKTYKVGDRVSGFFHGFKTARTLGSFAIININDDCVGHAPEQFNDDEAVAAPLCLTTAWDVVERSQISPAGQVLVLGGATAVGSFAIQLLKNKYNVAKVVATCSEKSSEYVKSFGADETIDYSGDLNAKLLDTLQDGKYTAIIDTVGDGGVGWIANQLVAEPWADSDKLNFSTVAGTAVPGHNYGIRNMLVGIPTLIFRTLFGRLWGIRYGFVTVSPESWPKVLEYLQSNTIKVPIDSVVPYGDSLKAIDRAMNVGARGKVVIKF